MEIETRHTNCGKFMKFGFKDLDFGKFLLSISFFGLLDSCTMFGTAVWLEDT
ncbi:hypothetical protein RhiirA4_491078 [Rhizophagus irregularis]|uniref:Uncharacterized protein n=1 Tax=Rhizophagus irregularis TaxID=588596 RepID=A0A2I1HW64_9GLOM|nr:hypothetical protein RhiirA4_491078 [Rhizophagus irregularis]